MPSTDAEPRATLRALFDEAVRAVSAGVAMPATVPVSLHGRTVVIAVGKGAAAMMAAAQARAKRPIEELVVTRHGHLPAGGARWPGVEVIEAGHPYPDEHSVAAAHRPLALAGTLGAGDRLLVLLSGGGSALMAAPAPGLALADKQATTRALLQSGATIEEINRVRKHLSLVKGGRLAVAAGHAAVTTWIISDVPGDDPGFVSSGPTVPDTSSLAQAREIMARYRIGAPGVHAIACDTDGIDGTEDAAGAIITPDTLARAAALGLDAATHLAENNAYLFFEALGDLVVTGPTLTNVNDFRAILIEGEA